MRQAASSRFKVCRCRRSRHPNRPKLLPIIDAAAISWQGSCGATGYQVERAARHDGPWQVIATNVDEAATQYRPDFADENVPAGRWYYRVRAENNSGQSGHRPTSPAP